jgi:tetratricopeptide (TPR) repeat protein
MGSVKWLWLWVLGATLLAGCNMASRQDQDALAGGFTAFTQKHYEQSATAANTYITKFPDDPHVDEAYYLRGQSRAATGDAPGAAQDLNMAIAKTKRADLKAKAYRALGDMSFNAQRFEQAIDYYNQALNNYPAQQADPQVYYRLGAALQDLGRWTESKPNFQRAAALTTDTNLKNRALIRASATAFNLQFGAYTVRANADNEARRLAGLGIRAVVVPDMGVTSLVFTVRAGSFPDYAHADAARQSLQAKFPLVRIVP